MATNVRDRVQRGQHVRPNPLAQEIGVSSNTVYGWISEGKLEAIKFEKTLMIPAHAAARLLGLKPTGHPQAT